MAELEYRYIDDKKQVRVPNGTWMPCRESYTLSISEGQRRRIVQALRLITDAPVDFEIPDELSVYELEDSKGLLKLFDDLPQEEKRHPGCLYGFAL
jgi:hypothetical protein